MLRPADLADGDRAVAERDEALPGLARVLDPGALAELVATGSPELAGEPVVCRYLRYKPGTSLVASVRAGDEDLLVEVYRPDDGKLAKHVSHAARRGALRALDGEHGVIVADAVADRALPGIAAVRERYGMSRSVVYKAGRRWVGADGARAVKVHRPADLAQVVSGSRLVGTRLPTPGVRHVDAPLGIVETEFVAGTGLRGLEHRERAEAVFRTGAALARLHTADTPVPAGARAGRGAVPAGDERIGPLAIDGVCAVLPELASRARAVAAAVEAETSAPTILAVVHGDFSADQIMVRDDGRIVVLDLDRAGIGEPLGDLARWRAAAAVEGEGDDDTERLLAGYETAAAVDRDRLDRLSAGAVLARLVEPFRLRHPDWRIRVERLMSQAERWAGLR